MLTLSTYAENAPASYAGLLPDGWTPSPEQGVAFTFLLHETSSFMLWSGAGTGKTTTIVRMCSLIPKHFSVRFIAFAKVNATELQTRLPQHVQSSTFHSAWFQALQRALPSRPKVDANKTKLLLKENLSWNEMELYSQFVCRLVGYAKSVGLGALVPDEEREWHKLINYFNLTLDSDDADEGLAVRIARDALRDSNSNLRVIDFDDMLYLPLLRNVTCDKSNYIFVDEAQDLNGVQRALLPRMLPVGIAGNGIASVPSRLIAVGDPNQAIYGFRGADSDSMEQLRDAFDAEVLPLSVSYRCSRAVVEEANRALSETL